MRYLKLYEAFSSNTLSKLYKHLKKKNASNKSLIQFKEDMKVIAKSFDIPMDKISEEDVSYISRRKALPLRSEAKNDSGIWAIKFWFDKDGEYIGTSGTGNAKFVTSNVPSSGSYHSKPYSKAQWDKIKKSMTFGFPKTGYLIPILNDEYDQLKTGDEVIGCLCDPEEYDDYVESRVDRLVCGKIFLDGNGQVYFIHDDDVAEGSEPRNRPSEEYPDIEWGDYSWSIADTNKIPGPDHFNLHKVTKSDTPISYYSEKVDNEDSNNPFEFNLSLEEIEDNKLILSDWVGNIDEKNKIEKEADFAVILYVDGILSRGLKSPKEKSVEREESRKGAVALMTDEEFKKVNLERIMKKVVEKIGVTPESVELKNLQKVVATIMSSGISESYAFLGIITRDYRAIDNFSYQIKRLVSCLSVEGGASMLNFVYGEFANEYRRMKRQSSESYKNKKAAMDVLKESVELKPLHDAIMRISSKITKSILSKDITRGEDLKKIFFKLASIEDMTRDDDFIFTYKLRDFIESIRYAASNTENVKAKVDALVGSYCDLESEDVKTDLQRDLEKLKEIESYIDDIMK
jgi:hypothetical protein